MTSPFPLQTSKKSTVKTKTAQSLAENHVSTLEPHHPFEEADRENNYLGPLNVVPVLFLDLMS